MQLVCPLTISEWRVLSECMNEVQTINQKGEAPHWKVFGKEKRCRGILMIFNRRIG
jgi:hypothetical protein